MHVILLSKVVCWYLEILPSMGVSAEGRELRSQRRLLGVHNHRRQLCSEARCCDRAINDCNLPCELCRDVWAACETHTWLLRMQRTR